MSMIATKKALMANAILKAQYDDYQDIRYNVNVHNAQLAQGKVGRAGNAVDMDPRMWLEMDTQTRQLMLPEGGGSILLNDLMPLVKSVHIGVLATSYRQYGSEFEAQTSLDGQHRKPMDRGQYNYDGTLVLVHTSQFGKQWREWEGETRMGFDSVADDQAASVRAVNRKMINTFMNGSPLTYKGIGAFGFRNSPNVIAVDLGAGGLNFDFTDQTETFADIWAAFQELLDAIHGTGNNAEGDATVYISSQIMTNFQRIGTALGNIETFLAALSRAAGVAAIKKSQELTGNQILMVTLNTQYVRPVVGMPVNTVPMDRKTPMDDYQFLTWGAAGLEIYADAEGRSGVLYAAG